MANFFRISSVSNSNTNMNAVTKEETLEFALAVCPNSRLQLELRAQPATQLSAFPNKAGGLKWHPKTVIGVAYATTTRISSKNCRALLRAEKMISENAKGRGR
jgi:hypothetical protein